jgi:hypothetical protein
MMLRDSDEFRRGRNGEQLVARHLIQAGWYVIPSYDYSGEDGSKAPLMRGLHDSFVIPDLDTGKDGRRVWVEVKTKKQASPRWTEGDRPYHGISLKHWRDYLEIERITGCAVYLIIYEECSGEFLCQSVKKLKPALWEYRGGKMGRCGMAFFPRDAFQPLRRR